MPTPEQFPPPIEVKGYEDHIPVGINDEGFYLRDPKTQKLVRDAEGKLKFFSFARYQVKDPRTDIKKTLTQEEIENYVVLKDGQSFSYPEYVDMYFSGTVPFKDIKYIHGEKFEPEPEKVGKQLPKSMLQEVFGFATSPMGLQSEDNLMFAQKAAEKFGGEGGFDTRSGSKQQAAKDIALGLKAYEMGLSPESLLFKQAGDIVGIGADDLSKLALKNLQILAPQDIDDRIKNIEEGAEQFKSLGKRVGIPQYTSYNMRYGYEVLGPLLEGASEEEKLDTIVQSIRFEGEPMALAEEEEAERRYGGYGFPRKAVEYMPDFPISYDYPSGEIYTAKDIMEAMYALDSENMSDEDFEKAMLEREKMMRARPAYEGMYYGEGAQYRDLPQYKKQKKQFKFNP